MLALEEAVDVEVVGEAPDSDVARTVAEQLAPDVVMLGTHLPPLGGVGTAAVLREVLPNIEVALVVDTESERDEREVGRAVGAGITAFMPRGEVTADAVPVARALVARRPVLDARTAALIIADYDELVGAEPNASTAVEPRERAVLEQLAGGATLTRAAVELGLPAVTASNLVANALRKLHRHARRDAKARAAAPGPS